MQNISTFNQGNIVSTQIPSLNQASGDLVEMETDFKPHMVNKVVLDETFVGHQNYRFLPGTRNNNGFTFQFTLPNWTHTRDISLNLQYIFRLGGEGVISQRFEADPVWSTAELINKGGYHMTNGGLLSIFRNMKIKLGSQVDIFTAFEKQKCGYHILNTWLRGKWDQQNVFALIDRWDAWYPWNSGEIYTPYSGTETVFSFPTPTYTWPPSAQSDCIYERWLSRQLGKCGLLREADTDPGTFNQRGPDRFNEFVQNVSITMDKLHSIFQQNIILPPGLQFIIEFDCPIYQNYQLGVIENFPANATWANIGSVMVPFSYTGNIPVPCSAPDDLTFKPVEYYKNNLFILTSINLTSVFNSVTLNSVNLKPEIARSLQSERIKKPLIYNFKQMVGTVVGKFFPGQTTYNFSLPPNQGIPTQFMFAWVNNQCTTVQARDYVGSPGMPQSSYTTGNYEEWSGNPPPPGVGALAYDGPAYDLYELGFGDVPHTCSSLTPLPVPYRRIIINRGGFQEVFLYGSFYDGLDKHTGFTASNPGVVNTRAIQNACVDYGAKNLTPDASRHYYDRLLEFQYEQSSLNNLGKIDRMNKWSFEYRRFTNAAWECFQMDPAAKDLGKFSSDQNAYTIDITMEMDLGLTDSINRTFLTDTSQLICVRVLPAQISIGIDGTTKIYTWPNLLVDPTTVVSANPPPAGAGGSI